MKRITANFQRDKYKSFSTKRQKTVSLGPAVIQDQSTRQELKENEEALRKGEIIIWIAFGIAGLSCLITIAAWPALYM